jgi:hypothetical protein
MSSIEVKRCANQAVAASAAAEGSCVTARAKECLTAAKAWVAKSIAVNGNNDDYDIVRAVAAIAHAETVVSAMWSV